MRQVMRGMRVQSARTTESETPLKLPYESEGKEGSLRWYAHGYHQWMLEMNYSLHTIKNQRCFFGKFLKWCEARGIERPGEVTQELIERFQRNLYQHVDEKTGEGYSVNTQREVGMAVHSLFRWMKKRGHLRNNPAADIELPRSEQRLPKHALTIQEVEKILSLPDIEQPEGIRDRAILEVFYSTGIRREELSKIKVYDIDPRQQTIMVRQGKGKRDRLLPIGERALMWVDKYLKDARPVLVQNPDHGYLFVALRFGYPMTARRVGEVAKYYVDEAKLDKKGACHLFRHAMATHFLENGAEVKFIQQMLGHKNMASTDAYANMSVRKLLEVHAELHPAKYKPRSEPGESHN